MKTLMMVAILFLGSVYNCVAQALTININAREGIISNNGNLGVVSMVGASVSKGRWYGEVMLLHNHSFSTNGVFILGLYNLKYQPLGNSSRFGIGFNALAEFGTLPYFVNENFNETIYYGALGCNGSLVYTSKGRFSASFAIPLQVGFDGKSVYPIFGGTITMLFRISKTSS